MLLTMTGKHVEITDAIRAHVQEKVEKLPRYFDGLSQVEVIIDGSEGGRPSVEIIARGEHSVLFVAKETGEEMYACIDVAVHKLERQLRRKKDKQRNNKHAAGVGEQAAELNLGLEAGLEPGSEAEPRKEDVA